MAAPCYIWSSNKPENIFYIGREFLYLHITSKKPNHENKHF